MNELPDREISDDYSEFARDHAELRADLLGRLEESSVLPPPMQTRRMVRVIASLAAVAAVVAVALVVFMSQRITLADVQAAMDRQLWIHVKYSDGEESWTCRSLGRTFQKDAGGRVQLFDDVNHIWMQYVPGDDHVTESRPSQKELEELARWKQEGRSPGSPPKPAGYRMPYEREQRKVIVDGRQLLRFDTYYTDALDQRRLDHQMWVDPKTQLQVRSRRWVEADGDAGGQFVEGAWDFPETGPASIYEIGVPNGLKIVRAGAPDQEVPLPRDVQQILAETRRAQAGFPERFRLLIWPVLADDAPHSCSEGLFRIYWNGNPTRTERKNMFTPGLVDWSGVKIRQQQFWPKDLDRLVRHGKISLPESMLSMPETPTELDAWLEECTLVSLDVSDGTRQYLWYASQKLLQVWRINTGPGLSGISSNVTYWPREYQWPMLKFGEDSTLTVVGKYEILDCPLEEVPGSVAVRLVSQPGQQSDFYLDPAHDYICLKYVLWKGVGENAVKWTETDLSDLQQFPTGQWYATRMRSVRYGSKAEGIPNTVLKRAIDITLLGEDEFPPDAFDGEKLIEDAKAMGFKISH